MTESYLSNIWVGSKSGEVLHYEDRKVLKPHEAIETVREGQPNGQKWRLALWCVKAPESDKSLLTALDKLLRDYGLSTIADRIPGANRGAKIVGPEVGHE